MLLFGATSTLRCALLLETVAALSPPRILSSRPASAAGHPHSQPHAGSARASGSSLCRSYALKGRCASVGAPRRLAAPHCTTRRTAKAPTPHTRAGIQDPGQSSTGNCAHALQPYARNDVFDRNSHARGFRRCSRDALWPRGDAVAATATANAAPQAEIGAQRHD